MTSQLGRSQTQGNIMQRAALAQPDIPAARKPLGRFLVESGVITSDQLIEGLNAQMRLQAPLGEILIANGWASEADICQALSRQFAIQLADFEAAPPDSTLCAQRSAQAWLRDDLLAWRRTRDGIVLIATDRPDRFETHRAVLEKLYGKVAPVIVSEESRLRETARLFDRPLAQAASHRTPAEYSSRNWHWAYRSALPVLVAACLLAALIVPVETLAVLTLLSIVTMTLFALLKASALCRQLTHHPSLIAPRPSPEPPARYRLPKVSVLVPLYREEQIANALILRLKRLTYPKALLDVVLVLEAKDQVTRLTLAQTDLPPWMRVVEVPADGPLTTKPRAMNYALDFCKGDIIGIWDAEDAPASDQIEKITEAFASASPDVVCLQGILDYYNPRSNWLSRCFTIEYATWFRVILPGIARLGLVVPLGGTSVFMKRSALEELGGWDAHNVTEDADLGMRLCRKGYRTETVDSVTYEEANCRPWPWVKQRSRWLKGFLVTYLVHMRRPTRLARDLGFWRFLSFQAFFLGTLGQFLLAPIMWSYWLLIAGLPHPIADSGMNMAMSFAVGLFIATEALAWIAGLIAVSRSDRRFLVPFIPTMMLYFPLGTLAMLKAVIELAVSPYFWDKTQHGVVPESSKMMG